LPRGKAYCTLTLGVMSIDRAFAGGVAGGWIGKYLPLIELGEGGTANVYLAAAQGPSGIVKLVVLKVLKPDVAPQQDFQQMFLREARLTARLNHRNVVQINEVFLDSGLPVIVMEYLEGQPLSAVVARADPLPLAMHIYVICEALNGLHHAHELADFDGKPLNVVHRDVSPQNVFVSFEGEVSVLDFGVAKLQGSAQTQTGILKGKLRYMAPEQILNTGVDRRADLFAVGVMLWEAATGRKMWSKVSDITVMNSVINGTIPLPRSVRPDVPKELERICMKALSVDREQRHSTAAELQAELEAFLAEYSGPVTARPLGQLVSSLFEEERKRIKEVTEQQLAILKTVEAPNRTMERLPVVSLVPAPPEARLSTAEATSLPAPRHTNWFALVVVGLVIALVAAIYRQATRVTDTPRVPTASAATEPSASAVGPPPVGEGPSREASRVALRVQALPPTARLYLDDQPLPTNPFIGNFPSDGREHVIRAEGSGYVTGSTTATFDTDRDLTITLERVKTPPGGTAHPRPGPASCDPPYAIDSRGIRHFKPGCF
jgi:eukaryotic-like serine/threonine-protein kinase